MNGYEKRGQVVSTTTPFQDTDAIATTKAYAQKNGLSGVSDLAKVSSFSLGARPEFKSRFNGLKGMKGYGVKNAKFKQLALGLQYPALDKGDVDAANVFSTDAQLASGKYTVLKDPRASSASRTSTSSSTRPSTTCSAARRSWTSSTRSTRC